MIFITNIVLYKTLLSRTKSNQFIVRTPIQLDRASAQWGMDTPCQRHFLMYKNSRCVPKIKKIRGRENISVGTWNLRTLKPVGIKCEKSRHQRKDAKDTKRAENMQKEPCFMEEKQILLYRVYRTTFRSHWCYQKLMSVSNKYFYDIFK